MRREPRAGRNCRDAWQAAGIVLSFCRPRVTRALRFAPMYGNKNGCCALYVTSVQSSDSRQNGEGNRWPCTCISSSVGNARTRKGLNLEERLKSLMQDLGNAI